MMPSVKQGALIGCGFFAENHLHAWQHMDGAKIVALCDTDLGKAQAMADRFGIDNVFDDAATLLDTIEIDYIDIVTTADSHRSLVELGCAAGITVLCQKPFAENQVDAEAMVTAADKASVALIVHENFRWQRSFVEMKQLIADNRIGTPHFARFSFRHGYDNYRNQPYLAEIERFSIMDVGLHLFDLARHFMGDVAQLTCHTQQLNPVVRGEDAFTAMLVHTSDATSVIECSFYSTLSPEPFPQTLACIEGSFGTLELRADYVLVLHDSDGQHVLDVEPPVPVWGERPWHCVQDSVRNFQTHALSVINAQAMPQPSGEHNLATLKLALAAYESARLKTTIAMADWQESGG